MSTLNSAIISITAMEVLAHIVKPTGEPISFKECLESYYPKIAADAINMRDSLCDGDIVGWNQELIDRQKKGLAIAQTLEKFSAGNASLDDTDKTNLLEGYQLISQECSNEQSTLDYGQMLASGKREVDVTGRIIKNSERLPAEEIVHGCREKLITWGHLKKQYKHLLLLVGIRPPSEEKSRA